MRNLLSAVSGLALSFKTVNCHESFSRQRSVIEKKDNFTETSFFPCILLQQQQATDAMRLSLVLPLLAFCAEIASAFLLSGHYDSTRVRYLEQKKGNLASLRNGAATKQPV